MEISSLYHYTATALQRKVCLATSVLSFLMQTEEENPASITSDIVSWSAVCCGEPGAYKVHNHLFQLQHICISLRTPSHTYTPTAWCHCLLLERHSVNKRLWWQASLCIRLHQCNSPWSTLVSSFWCIPPFQIQHPWPNTAESLKINANTLSALEVLKSVTLVTDRLMQNWMQTCNQT